MLQTLREYGLERLGQMKTAEAYYKRYTAYYVDLAEKGYAGLQSTEQSAWIQRLYQEKSNLIVALDWLFSRQEGQDNALLLARMVKAIARFWILQGWVNEITQWLEEVRFTLPYLPVSLQVGLLNEIGNAVQTKGDFKTAETAHREALAIARQAGESSLTAHTLHFLALLQQAHTSAGLQKHLPRMITGI